MRVFVFEWMVGGGLWWDDHGPDESDECRRQGAAMFDAVTSDFCQAGHEVFATLDTRCNGKHQSNLAAKVPVSGSSGLRAAIQQLASQADRILLIAPESQMRLELLHRWLSEFDSKILGPAPEFVTQFASKSSFLHYLHARDIAVPPGRRLDRGFSEYALDEFPLPAVLKPDRGAGGEGVQFVNDRSDFHVPDDQSRWRLEAYVPGTPMSVAMIQVDGAVTLMPPLVQELTGQHVGGYVKSLLPTDEQDAWLATKLARQVATALPPWNGYVGLDLVVHRAGQLAVPIELNCRLTMSYLKLREIGAVNLSELLLGDSLPT